MEDSDFDALDEEALEREEKLAAAKEEKDSARRSRAKRRANVYVEPSQRKRPKVRKGLQGNVVNASRMEHKIRPLIGVVL